MSFLYRWLGPLYDAILCPGLPLSSCWRLLALQPVVLLTNAIQYWRGIRSKHPKTTIWIPLRRAPGHCVRAIVYHPLEEASKNGLRALHLNIHGGGDRGGGDINISPIFPRYTFPVAHRDVQDVAEWLIKNAGRLWGADPRLMSVSGFSTGGIWPWAVKAAVMFYAPVDLRLSPWEKPKPAKYPENDPLAFALPLMDAYAGSEREKYRDSLILHPILADIESLPRNMLFLCAKVDLLLYEQTVFVNRLKDEAAALNRKIEGLQETSQDHSSSGEARVPLASKFESAARNPYNIEGIRPRSQRSQGQSPKDPFVNAIDLKKNVLVQVSVPREFGLVDMYRDQGYQNPRHIEDNLGKLEGHAGRIIKKASDKFEVGQTLELTRRERDTIRNIAIYDSNDKHRLESYMRERKFKSPRDIWYANLKTFLDIEMDPDTQWINKVHERAFPDDAMMFINHMQSKFMAFCRPLSEEDEFILTHNAYGVFEGPSDVQIDPATGGAIEGAYTEYHNFAPVSAKFIIILRSSLLVDPSKEGAEGLQEKWEIVREEVGKQHLFPEKAAVSLLESLPIKKCGNSYSTTINGKLVLKPNRGPQSEPATKGDTIVYRSKSALGRTLKSYLETVREGFKLVTHDANDPHLAFLKKLEKIAGQWLGKSALGTRPLHSASGFT
ncbi:hypothetical protein BDV34DRAFT_212970 [Aspergillus parasiticus]|uniref:Alpha/beta hydrolase fold-3 domain-containing protein n=1 Tax=Aspergillus parasiticus TaxID=5067 RepID=A0A5N6DKI5_ASPPA|nr:hypothetical protein BDV34DRAFT_212970 [Aspergillus parasiticus]